jgi:signal peptidase II
VKPKHFGLILAASLVVLIDVWIKKIALNNSWTVHKNTGIAFDLPLWSWVAVLLIILIAFGLLFFAYYQKNNRPWFTAAALIIVIGAIGNLLDRFTYGFIVDYLIFEPTGSAFNLSDLVIIAGILIFFLSKRKS